MQAKLSNEEADLLSGGSSSANKVAPSDQETQAKSNLNSNKEPAKMPNNKDNSVMIEKMKIIYQTKKEKNAESLLSFQKECDGFLTKVVVTPDSKFVIAAYCPENSIKIFDLNNKTQVHRFKGIHEESISSIAVSADNKYVISCSEDKSIKIFDLQTKQQIHHFVNAHEETIKTVIVTPDSKFIASGSDDKSIKLFDIHTKQQIHHFKDVHQGKFFSLDPLTAARPVYETLQILIFSKNESSLEMGHHLLGILLFGNETIKFNENIDPHDEKNPKSVAAVKELTLTHDNPDEITSLACTPDNRFLISGSRDESMKVFDLQTRQQVHHFEGNDDGNPIHSVAVTPDSKYIVCGSEDYSIRIFELDTKQLVHHFQNAHSASVKAVAVTSDNRFIVSGSFDQSIRVFDIETKNQVLYLPDAHTSLITTLTVSPDNKFIVSGCMDSFVKVFHLRAKREIHCFENCHGAPVHSLALTSDNRYLVSSSNDDQCIKIHDFYMKQRVHESEFAHPQQVMKVALTPDDKYIISAATDNAIRIFDFETKQIVHSFEEGQDWVTAMAVSRDNKILFLAGGADGNKGIKFFDLQTRQHIHRINNVHQEWIGFLLVTPDNKYLISASNDKSIKMFDLQTKQETYHFQKAHQESISAITVTPDSKLLISGSDDNSIKIFDLDTKQQIHHWKNAHEGRVNALVVTTDCRYLISTSPDRTIKIFDMHTKQQIQHFKNHAKTFVAAATVTSNNQNIIAVCDHSIKTFDFYPRPSPQESDNIPDPLEQHISALKEIGDESQDLSVLKQEFHFVYGGTKQLSTFNCVDDFLFDKAPDYSVSQAIKQPEFLVLPFRWTILHVVSVFANHDFIAQMPEYSEFQMPFLLDAFNRTPLHYLIAQRNLNFVTANIVFNYICDYLEDCQLKNPFEFQKIIESLSPLLPFILQKIENKSRIRLFSMVLAKSSAPHSNPAPLFGNNLSDSAVISNSPVLTQYTRDQIWDDKGTAQVEFRSNLLYLDYDILSQDMNEISECFKRQKSEDFFKVPAVTKLIDHLWKQAETTLMIFFAIYSAFIIALSVYLTFQNRSLAYEIILLAVSVSLTVNELWQLANLKKDYLMDAWNWFDVSHLLLTAAFLIARIADNDNELARAWISTIIIVLGYLRWISLLKIFKPTRNLIQVVITIVKDMTSFIIVIALIIVGFSVIFLVFNREAGYGDYLYEAYNVLYGPADISDDAAWPFSQKLIMAVLAFFLNVVLLNLLISIMGDSYGQVLEMRDRTDSLTRLEMISEAAVYKKFLRPKHQTQRGYLVYCLPVELAEEESGQNAELDNVIKTVKKLIQRNNQESKQELQALKDKVQENTLRLNSMKNEISSLDKRIFIYLQDEFAKLHSSTAIKK